MDYINDFSTRADLIDVYGNNALLLYALQLRFSISDIVSVASDALTDGGDDKKCDLRQHRTKTALRLSTTSA